MSAQRKDKQKSAQIVSSISKLAGILARIIVGIGKKAPGFRAFVKVKALAAALESELAVANRKLDRTREKVKKTRSQLSSQLKAFQAKNGSLNSALKQAQNKTRGARIKGSKMSVRVATLESELDTAKQKTKKTQSQLSSQLKALQAKNKSLNSTLKQTQNKARETKTSRHTAALETKLATVNRKRAELQEKTKKVQSQLSSQLDALQAKNESAAAAKKIDAVKTKVDQLVQQICDSGSKTQPGTIKTTRQQNKKQAKTKSGK
jgi:chromosome segregation ATPase